MTDQPLGQPCRYCVAAVWGESTTRSNLNRAPNVPEPADCEIAHRDDPRVYQLATAMAAVLQQRNPTDAQIGYFLSDADQVVDDFQPTPHMWRVHRLPARNKDQYEGIDVRLRINGVTYLALEGGKDIPGDLVRLATFREQQRQADAEHARSQP